MRAVPRLRGRVPVVGAVRPPHGRHARRAPGRAIASRPLARRLAEWFGYRVVLPRHWLLRRVDLAACASDNDCTWCRGASDSRGCRRATLLGRSTPSRAADADVWLFTGCVMDAWQRDIHRAALDVMHAVGVRRGHAGQRWRLLRRAAHSMQAGHDEARRLARRVIASMPGDAPDRRRQRGVRRGDEGLRPSARHRHRSGVRGSGPRLLRVAGRCAGSRPCHRPADASSCRTRATSVTCSEAHGAVARRAGAGLRRLSRPTTTGSAAAPVARTACWSRSSRARSATARSRRSGVAAGRRARARRVGEPRVRDAPRGRRARRAPSRRARGRRTEQRGRRTQ